MRYSLIAVTNGNFAVKSEHGENKQAALVAFHQLSAAYWNAPDVTTAMIKVVDENLDTVDGKMEYITHDAVAPAPVVEEEPVEESEPTEES
ncbi:MAG: hypothetical protein IIZ78_08110 [Clostridiales bacterium]|nr:hypothetical protein [Clostridiales bacterium]